MGEKPNDEPELTVQEIDKLLTEKRGELSFTQIVLLGLIKFLKQAKAIFSGKKYLRWGFMLLLIGFSFYRSQVRRAKFSELEMLAANGLAHAAPYSQNWLGSRWDYGSKTIEILTFSVEDEAPKIKRAGYSPPGIFSNVTLIKGREADEWYCSLAGGKDYPMEWNYLFSDHYVTTTCSQAR